jgi:hypothetical protein
MAALLRQSLSLRGQLELGRVLLTKPLPFLPLDASTTIAESGQESFVGGDGPHQAIPVWPRKGLAA